MEFCVAMEWRMPLSMKQLGIVPLLLMLWAPLCAGASEAGVRYRLLDKSAPEISQRLFVGASRNFRLSERRGEVVLVGFWTSWCGSCRAYLERLGAMDATYAKTGLVVLGVSLDDDSERAQALAQTMGLQFRNTVDSSKNLGARFFVNDVPMTLLIDREGVVRYVHGDLDAAGAVQLVAEIRQLLDE
jgi:thiol-disulfide isomerase/thioredoxin